MRRTRIDLGQQPATAKEVAQLERKRKRWATVNKHRSENENPFLAAIKPDHEHYGDPSENSDQLKARLNNLEFGNYPSYFNYRNTAAANSANATAGNSSNQTEPAQNDHTRYLEAGLSDERLGLMKKEWFKGKTVLDVGCNRGHLTYAIAKLFSPRLILGIDIDGKMIRLAKRDLQNHLKDELAQKKVVSNGGDAETEVTQANMVADEVAGEKGSKVTVEAADELNLLSYIGLGASSNFCSKGHTENDSGVSESEATSDGREEFPMNIHFAEHNYVLARDELVERQQPRFDTIVCLSVTKWIHLNYRDDGLKRFLRRMHKHLKLGGLLILELQPFDNYYRKKKLSDRLRSNYYSIKFKPEQIDEYLLGKEVGFRQMIFSSTTEHECAGFKRPFKVFLK